MRSIRIPAIAAISLFSWHCGSGQGGEAVSIAQDESIMTQEMDHLDTAVFAGGCFWCTEAIFAEVKGVIKAESGYTGGQVDNPSYRQVSMGTTGHAEAVLIQFDPSVISFKELLEIFWKTHNPTTLNRQGADVGTQYRSAIFYTSLAQKETAEFYRKELDAAGIWSDPIVTEISPFNRFYKAEQYHQDYYANNPAAGYCNVVITPKLEKFRKVFADKLK